jgi:hypothetical protein
MRVPKVIPARSTSIMITPSPHRSEIMTSGRCGETGVSGESSPGGTGRTGGEPRAAIRTFVPAPARRTGEAEPHHIADYPLRGRASPGPLADGRSGRTTANPGRPRRAGDFGTSRGRRWARIRSSRPPAVPRGRKQQETAAGQRKSSRRGVKLSMRTPASSARTLWVSPEGTMKLPPLPMVSVTPPMVTSKRPSAM